MIIHEGHPTLRPLLFATVFLLASCASMPDITPEVRKDLAPTGKIRVGINYNNFILVSKDKTTGESRGVAVDLSNELGRRLGVPVEIVPFASVAALGDAVTSGAWDIAFLGSDPQREKIMSFSPAYLELDATYLVPGNSPLKNAADADRAGIRITAQGRANYELWLQRNLKQAKLEPAPTDGAAFDFLAAGKADALAGLTERLIEFSAKMPGSRVLEGRFMAVQQSIAMPKGREAGLAYLKSVVEDAKASGLVARGIEKTGARGVSVAPPAR